MNKKLFLGILLSLCTAFAAGQEKKSTEHVFSLQAGYGNLLKGSRFLTQSADSYRQQLRDGIAWNASYYYRPASILSFGFQYSGHSSSASHTEGADHLYTHYLAPQLAWNFLRGDRWNASLHGGYGFFLFRNHSKVFGKDRKVHQNNVGCNVGLKMEYKLNAHWGIGGDCSLVAADQSGADIKYHGQTIDVHQNNYLRPFSVTGGIYYHF